MKVKLKSSAPERKLVAVLGRFNDSIYFPRAGSGVLCSNGQTHSYTLKGILDLDPGSRTPVYEGDTVEITF